MAGKIYVAVHSAVVYTDDGPVTLRGGYTRVREGHPLLKGREDLFREDVVQYEVEDARSAPQDAPVPVPTSAAPEAAAVPERAPAVPRVVPAPAPRPQRGPRKGA